MGSRRRRRVRLVWGRGDAAAANGIVASSRPGVASGSQRRRDRLRYEAIVPYAIWPEDDATPPRWRVCFDARVVVRSEPRLDAPLVGTLQPNAIVVGRASDGWVSLQSGGHVLIDGAAKGLGMLLERCAH